MRDSVSWQYTVMLCVAALCGTLIYCCSQFKPARYERIETATTGTRAFDNQSGDVITLKFK
jgi:hypothetical protein